MFTNPHILLCPPPPGDLSSFKIVELVEIAGKKGVSAGRNATRESLTDGLVKAGGYCRDAVPHSRPQTNYVSCHKLSVHRWQHQQVTPRALLKAVGAPVCITLPELSNGQLTRPPTPGLVRPSQACPPPLPASYFLSKLVPFSVDAFLTNTGVSLEDLSRGQLVDLAAKLGKAGLSRDLATARSELASLIGGSGSATATWRATPAPTASSGYSSSSSQQTPPASWRSSGSSSSSGAAAGGDRWAKYSTGSAGAAASGGSAVWRKSGSHNASGSKLSAGDLAALRIDDLRDLVKKTGVC